MERGVSYEPPADAPLMLDNKVAVVGGAMLGGGYRSPAICQPDISYGNNR